MSRNLPLAVALAAARARGRRRWPAVGVLALEAPTGFPAALAKASRARPLEKVDPELRTVWGWVSVIEEGGVPVVDSQGDVIGEDVLLTAAHDFMKTHRVGGFMHLKKAGAAVRVGDVVESVVFTKDLQKALGIDLGRVGWLAATAVEHPAVWDLAKRGLLTGYSLGGTGIRKELSS
jgi:hypothetical protein